MAAERVEVAADRLDVDRHVRHGLGAVDQHERAGRVGHLGHLADRVDRAERVRDVGERDELRLEPEQHLEHVEAQDPVVGDRDELEVAVLLLDEELPRDEVGVVLHLGQDDRVAAGDVAAAPRVRDEVDRLGRVAGEDDLVAVGRVDEAGDLDAGRLVLGRRLLADRVDPAMDVGVVLAVVVGDGVDDDARLLAARRRVEVDQRMAVDLPARGSGSRPAGRVGVEDGCASPRRRPASDRTRRSAPVIAAGVMGQGHGPGVARGLPRIARRRRSGRPARRPRGRRSRRQAAWSR